MRESSQPCPLCTNDDTTLLQGIDIPVYYFCGVCDLIYVDDRFILSREEERARYLLHNNSLENQGYVNMLERFLGEAVEPFVPAAGAALDFGSGPGPVLGILLGRKGFHVDLYDPYFAPEKAFAAKTYDLITCTETVEHIRASRDTWSLFADHLRVGGKLAVMTSFHPSLEEFPRWWYRRDRTHIRFYSRRTFEWICGHYPFRIVWTNGKNTITLERV